MCGEEKDKSERQMVDLETGSGQDQGDAQERVKQDEQERQDQPPAIGDEGSTDGNQDLTKGHVRFNLLDGDGFGQIAWLIDVGTFEIGYVIREQLQGEDAQDWLNDLVNPAGNQGEIVDHGSDVHVRRTGNGQNLGVSGYDLLQVAHDFFILGVLHREHDGGEILIDQGDRPVLHLAGWIALCVDVTYFLEFEGAFQRNGIQIPSA